MSEALFANLPRFDALTSPLRQPDFGARGADVQAVAPADTKETDEAAAFQAGATRQLAAMEATLISLTKAVDRVGEEARTQIEDTIVSLAEKLFPVLSQRFLAEEIGLHLHKLLPEMDAKVTVRCEPELAQSLRDVLNRSNRLSDLCDIVEDAEPGKDRVEVSWISGGVTFDFDGLLEACLARLPSTQTRTGEKTDGKS